MLFFPQNTQLTVFFARTWTLPFASSCYHKRYTSAMLVPHNGSWWVWAYAAWKCAGKRIKHARYHQKAVEQTEKAETSINIKKLKHNKARRDTTVRNYKRDIALFLFLSLLSIPLFTFFKTFKILFNMMLV